MAASCMRRGPQRRPWVGSSVSRPFPGVLYLVRGVPSRCISSPTSYIEEEEDAVCTSEEGEFFCCCCNARPLPFVMFLSFLLHEELLLPYRRVSDDSTGLPKVPYGTPLSVC